MHQFASRVRIQAQTDVFMVFYDSCDWLLLKYCCDLLAVLYITAQFVIALLIYNISTISDSITCQKLMKYASYEYSSFTPETKKHNSDLLSGKMCTFI